MTTHKLRFISLMMGGVTTLFMLVPGFGLNLVQAGPVEGDGVLDNWPYKYAISKDDDGSSVVTHEYARSSATDVNAAADAMNRTARQLASSSRPQTRTSVGARRAPAPTAMRGSNLSRRAASGASAGRFDRPH